MKRVLEILAILVCLLILFFGRTKKPNVVKLPAKQIDEIQQDIMESEGRLYEQEMKAEEVLKTIQSK